MSEQSLVTLYKNMNIDELKKECKKIILDKRDTPVNEMLSILNETDDIIIITIIMDAMVIKINDIGDTLIDDYYDQASDTIKRYIIMALSVNLKSSFMQFLLDEYYNNVTMRPDIRSKAFRDKKLLFMNLARYYENIPFNEENVEITQQLLKIIPRKEILQVSAIFAGSKIMDVYYAMPLEDSK